MTNKIIEEAIEKKFLSIRGWKNWEEYDKVRESLETDINVRNELIQIAIKLTKQERGSEELNWLSNILVMDFNNMDKSEIKDLIKLRHIKKLK